MKQEDIKHVLDTTPTEEGKELIFTHLVDRDSGKKYANYSINTSSYDHVKHLTGNLYYVYDDKDVDYTGNLKGSVFVGEFQ